MTIESHVHYTKDIVDQAVKKLYIEDPKFLKLGQDDCPEDVNGRTTDLEILCNLPGRDGALWRQLRHWVALNAPGLFERSPSPDFTLRCGRAVREDMRKQGLVSPPVDARSKPRLERLLDSSE